MCWLVMQDDVRLIKGMNLGRQTHIGSVISVAVGEIWDRSWHGPRQHHYVIHLCCRCGPLAPPLREQPHQSPDGHSSTHNPLLNLSGLCSPSPSNDLEQTHTEIQRHNELVLMSGNISGGTLDMTVAVLFF